MQTALKLASMENVWKYGKFFSFICHYASLSWKMYGSMENFFQHMPYSILKFSLHFILFSILFHYIACLICENKFRLRAFIAMTSTRFIAMSLFRTTWVKLNCLRTGVRRFHSSMYKWGLAPSLNYECCTFEQTADHVLIACLIYRPPYGAGGLMVLDDETRCWLTTSLPASDPGSTTAWSSKKINPVLFVFDLEWAHYQTTTTSPIPD